MLSNAYSNLILYPGNCGENIRINVKRIKRNPPGKGCIGTTCGGLAAYALTRLVYYCTLAPIKAPTT
jgi:hypothetical protein